LCAGGEAPWLKRQLNVYERFAELKSSSYDGRDAIFDHGENCRKKIGKLWGVESGRVSFLPTAADGMGLIARGLDWRPGDNIVTTNLEFPSVAYAWKDVAKKMGVEVRLVPHRNWRVYEEDLLDNVDERTRVLAVSQVSFYTGQNLDLKKISDNIKNLTTLFAVDSTHASGALNVPADLTDLCVSSSYKWLLATHGVAPCYLSEKAENQIRPTCFGWHNLQVWPPQGAERQLNVEELGMPLKLEPGNPAMIVVMFLEKSLDLILEVGADKIQNHNRILSEKVNLGLRDLGLELISPLDDVSRSGNTCFLSEDAQSVSVGLAKKKILVWGEYGRVRVSTHLYNSDDDVIRLINGLSEMGLS
jgi:selenocysteine lyase/cysteine desulfurase